MFLVMLFINLYYHSKQLASCRQTLAILQQDKMYLIKQINEANFKISRHQEKSEALDQQLIAAKHAREELYEKYMACRYLLPC